MTIFPIKHMKIGIITYHRSHNYGAVLQAYALKKYIENLGYDDVSFIDYWPQYHKDIYSLFNRNKFNSKSTIGKLKFLIKESLKYKRKKRRSLAFQFFIDTYIQPKSNITNTIYDLAIYGSDQIWRYQNQPTFKGYNTVYFGDNTIHAKTKIAFSASMGIININADLINCLKNNLSNFKAISVREKELEKIVKNYYKDVICTLDPVFLLDKKSWNNLTSQNNQIIKSDYILVYNLQRNKEVEKAAHEIHEKTGLPVYHILGDVTYLFTKEKVLETIGPLEFVSLINNAKYIITSSFHGTAFSILLNKNFYVYFAYNSERAYSLLNAVGLENRIIDSNFQFTNSAIDWDTVNNKLENLKIISKNYLIRNLSLTK